jgi:hypothetical protein
MFFDSRGLFQSNLNAVKDTPWSTQNCPLSWPTFGSWSKDADGTATTTSDQSESEQILATGDNMGSVKLFR